MICPLLCVMLQAAPATRPAGDINPDPDAEAVLVVDVDLEQSRGQDAPPLSQLGRVPAAGEFESDAHLLGGLGWREGLSDAGLTLTGAIFADGLYVIDGPNERGEVRNLLALDAAFDTTRLGWWDDATLFVRLYAGAATDGATGFPATLQEVDTVPAFEAVTVGELWLEQRFAGGRVRVRGGRMDANGDFATTEYATTFVTDSAAVTPTN